MFHIESSEVVFDQRQAAEFSKLSAKTLERHANAGEDVGRRKVGRRVLFFKSKLMAWLASQSTGLQDTKTTK